MAKIGMRRLYWAKHATEPTTALPTYATGVELGQTVRGNLTIAYADGKFYANDKLVEDVSEFSEGSVAAEIDHLTLAHAAELYGATLDDGELGSGGGDTPPYGGLGYIQVLMVNSVKKFRAFYYPKVKARMGDEAAETKAGSFTLNAMPITFTVMEPLFGKWRYVKEYDTEAAAVAYLETKLNVAVWHAISVQVNGAGTGEGASPSGVTMVAAGEDFVLTLTGTVDALYVDGVESKSGITAGKYTIADVAADHDIAVIFTPA
jgi:phi13 family phage major tail protein